MAFITLVQVFVNVIEQRPTWLISILIIPVPVFLSITVIISLDLKKQDYISLQGKLIEKKGYMNKGNFIKVMIIQDGKLKAFRINKEFDEVMNDIEIDHGIELQYFRRTKAVVQIRKLI